MKLISRRLNRNAEPQGSIESGSFVFQYACAPAAAQPADLTVL
jgi:hypothetical protein